MLMNRRGGRAWSSAANQDGKGDGSGEKRTAKLGFLLQSKTFRVECAIREQKEDTWTTKPSKVQAGDRVIIWKAKGKDKDRGVVAFGEVLTDPDVIAEAHSSYYVDSADADQSEEGVRVRYVLAPRLL